MQLEAVAQSRIARTALDFLERIILERIHGANGTQSVGIKRGLISSPVVLRFDALVLIRDGYAIDSSRERRIPAESR
jgi:hypothetical protein